VWVVRFGLLLALVALGLLALLAPQTPGTVSAPGVAAVSSPTPLPTQTPQPITSIILRGTPQIYPTATPFPSGLASVSIVDFSYQPATIRINAGQTVFWRNDGTEEHDVTGQDWHSGLLEPTYTYVLTFGTPGTYPYRCTIHLDMTGSVVVTG
jgi:hypothetical protein